jgi:hypothetical protein
VSIELTIKELLIIKYFKMRMPKGFSKWSLNEQESWLVKKYQEMLSEVDSVTRMLAKIRGGQRIKVTEVDRPDEAILKS